MKRFTLILQTMMKFSWMKSDDPRYSEEKQLLRQACFRSLIHHLEDHTIAVFEFATIWCDEHDTIDGIEQGFQDYLRSYAENAYANS